MADSATSSLRLRDQETGANDGQWGTYTDTNFTLVEEALSGVLSKSVAGSADVTLTSTNFTTDESRHAVLQLTGALTGNINVIIPNVQKTYFVFNNTSGSFTLGLKTSSGTAVEIPQGSKEYIYCDGSNAIVTLLGTTHSTNVATVAGQITPTNNISTVAGVAANITTVAGVSTDVTTVATAVTAGHVETVSSINAAVSSVSDNMPDVATVAGDSANLQTVAGQIAGTNNIATVAGLSANITTLAGISSAVSTVATNVADVTNFSDVYIGAASSNPSTRTDGSSLATGDLYFNTSTSALNIYGGSSFQAAALDASSIIAAVSSPTDNAVPRFNGTGGATLQNSAVIIDDSNNITGVAALTATGLASLADITLTAANPEILGNDTDGVTYLSGGASTVLGSSIRLHGNTHASLADDFMVYGSGTLQGHYDDSASTWNFQANKVKTNGSFVVGTGSGSYEAGVLGFSDSNYGFVFRPPQAGAIGAHLFEATDGSDLLTIAENGAINLYGANPALTANDTDGIFYISSNTTVAGASIRLHGDTHGSFADDIMFYGSTTLQGHYDDSASTWDFQANTIRTTGGLTVGLDAAPNYVAQFHSAASHGVIQFTNASTGSAAGDGSYIGVLNTSTTLRVWNQEAAPIWIGSASGYAIFTNGAATFTGTITAPSISIHNLGAMIALGVF